VKNKVLVLGASGDIGFAIVRKLVLDGMIVVAHFNHNKARISLLVEELGEANVIPIQADLTSLESVNELISEIDSIHSFVHAAGNTYEGLFEETTDQIIEELWSMHVYQPIRIIRELLPSIRQNGNGSIVLITSIWGETGASNEVMYSAVKGAQISFVKALGKELAPTGIRVNAVAPGAIETSMTDHYDQVDRSAIESVIPTGRMGRVEEIAGATSFLLSSEAGYITSHILSVNGGWYA